MAPRCGTTAAAMNTVVGSPRPEDLKTNVAYLIERQSINHLALTASR